VNGAALLLAVALLLLNGFFVGAEFAVISARRSQIEPLAAEGRRAARTTLWALEHLSLMLACAQLGITVASLGLGAVAEPAVAHLLEVPFAAVGLPEEFVLADLQDAREALEEITGRRAPDDLLAHIFARFCIGK